MYNTVCWSGDTAAGGTAGLSGDGEGMSPADISDLTRTHQRDTNRSSHRLNKLHLLPVGPGGQEEETMYSCCCVSVVLASRRRAVVETNILYHHAPL